ncbi:hypothetical protein LB424_02890 [Klebsiella pneumoniae]|uniref:hypothetical protein n=1 Tax=Klebsiella pneumoniae TaxID=573 RepID=UPI001E2DB144|nr:hypothetical protein [Klebsiella pneumoniae]MCD5639551.1 hypothetical protein [Klebsiella pneumoniae]
MNVYEMEGFLRGKCLPGDLKVNESNAEYLVRKLNVASGLKGELTAALATIEKCREVSGCPAGVDLQDWVKQMAAENVGLKSAITDHSQSVHFCLVCGKDDPCCTDDVCYVLSETPATDRIYAGIKAEGAEACVRALVTSDDDDFTDAPSICAEVARSLREGAK